MGGRLVAIHLQQVSKTYVAAGRQLLVLKPLDLTVHAGEIFGIIGHSGGGKSTLLRLINHLERPSSGRVWVNGQDLSQLIERQLRAVRRQIAMIFQHFNLLTSRTVAENIAFPLQLAKMPRQQMARRVAELLERMGLTGFANNYPQQLSGGQKQRVGIARALALSPSILLCDEATSALDPQTTQSMLDLLVQLNRELQLTIVVITHEMSVIRQICDRVAVLDAGSIVEEGTVANVFLHPQHAVTRSFVNETGLGADIQDVRPMLTGATCVRLTFLGQQTYQPIISRLARTCAVDCTILSGRIDHIKGVPYGQLIVSLEGGDLANVFAGLTQAGVVVEKL